MLLRKSDLISTESKELLNKFQNGFLDISISDKIFYLPNGFDKTSINPIKNINEKENIMITVGRIGSNQKNNEMMLNALEGLDLRDWKVYFIGPIEDSFHVKVKDFYTRSPKMRGKVVFLGNIDNKDKLYEWYNRSKVFFLTSQYEGFP